MQLEDVLVPQLHHERREDLLGALVLTVVHDDGIVDPRDTRTVLGIALSAVHSQTVAGRRGFGVFRM